MSNNLEVITIELPFLIYSKITLKIVGGTLVVQKRSDDRKVITSCGPHYILNAFLLWCAKNFVLHLTLWRTAHWTGWRHASCRFLNRATFIAYNYWPILWTFISYKLLKQTNSNVISKYLGTSNLVAQYQYGFSMLSPNGINCCRDCFLLPITHDH